MVNIISQILKSKPELAPSVVAFAVPDLTYAPSRSLAERRSKGVIKSFDHIRGCGFIACPELKAVFGHDVYVHAKQAGKMCQPGTEVSFAVLLNKENKPQAFDVQPSASPNTMVGASMPGKGMASDMGTMNMGMMGKSGKGMGDIGMGGDMGKMGMGKGSGMGGMGGDTSMLSMMNMGNKGAW